MARQPPKLSATPHGLIRSGAFLFFAFSLVIIFLLHQPQTNDEVGQSGAAQGTKNTEQPKTFGQTLATDPTAFFTFGLFLVGAAQAILFLRQLNIILVSLADTKKAARAAKRQAKLARDSLIFSQRAWIKIIDVQIVRPLEYSSGGGRTAITLKIANVGNTPAFDITPWITLSGIYQDGTHIDKFRAECEIIKKCPPPSKTALFPNDFFPIEDDYIIHFAYMEHDDVPRASYEMGSERYFFPTIRICVLYKFASDRENFHQTSVIQEIRCPDISGAKLGGAAIPAESLHLMRGPHGLSFYAD